jgi:carotenoid cleavage dioxygenase-like enzyme
MYGSEPLFAPAVGAVREDDGYVLEVVYDGWTHKSELQIYRADCITDHVCTLKLKHHVPHQFHGHFTADVFPLESANV